MISGSCLNTVSGGVVDGAPFMDGYQYGEMWKNWRCEGASARMPASAKVSAAGAEN